MNHIHLTDYYLQLGAYYNTFGFV